MRTTRAPMTLRRATLCAGVLALAYLLATPSAQARRLPSDPMRLDLDQGAWVHAGFEGGHLPGDNFGSMDLGGRAVAMPWLGLRGSLSLSYRSLAREDRTSWTVDRSWLGPELFSGWKLGDFHLRLGASIESGAPVLGGGDEDEVHVTLRLDSRHVPSDDWAVRARAGVRFEGARGFVHLEAVRVGTAAASDWPDGPDSTSFLFAGAIWRVDDLRALAFETMWSSEGGLWFSARYWAALWGEPSGPQTLVGVLVLGGSDALALSVSILHQL